jgi:hypothetical protein
MSNEESVGWAPQTLHLEDLSIFENAYLFPG